MAIIIFSATHYSLRSGLPQAYSSSSRQSVFIIVTIVIRDVDVKIGVDDARRRTHPLPHHHLLVLALDVVGLSAISNYSALPKRKRYHLQNNPPRRSASSCPQ